MTEYPFPKIVVVGGGVAGLEALLALRDLVGDPAATTLVSPTHDFTYAPMGVLEPFGINPPERWALDAIASSVGADFVLGQVRAVDVGEHVLELSDGSRIDYDFLIMCVGARPRPLLAEAVTFDPRRPEPLRALMKRIVGGELEKVAFVVPFGVTWSLPVYELALMTRRRAVEAGHSAVGVQIVTPEATPLAIFGHAASAALAAMLRERGIEFTGGSYAHPASGGLTLAPGDRLLVADAVIALPVFEGPAIPGLPADERGFIPIDEHARVLGAEGVYAAGDGTSFPIKQGGIATQQADAAAEHIAVRVETLPEAAPFAPVLRGRLLTGGASLFVRHELGGGHGEGSASPDYLWWPPHKISGRYLAPWLARESVFPTSEPPERSLEVEIAWPREWHPEPLLSGGAV